MLYDGDTFERGGRTFKVEFPFDDSHGAPWEECDGHGIVSEWTRRDKAPGEVIIASDRGSYRYYDVAETTQIAKRDGWGLSTAEAEKLAARLGRKPTRKQIVAEAVRRDCDYLRRWCNDRWHYVGCVVTLLDDEHDETGESESLWGIENEDSDYLEMTAHELADEILSRVIPAEIAARDDAMNELRV